jgi:Ca2+-binding EF-hand superfamily protein
MLFIMYDTDRSGVLAYAEFEQLLQQVWLKKLRASICPLDFDNLTAFAQLQSWRAHFDANDRDRSGALSLPEVAASLKHFGFQLPEPAYAEIFAAYDL